MKRSISFFLLILTIIPLAQSQRQITSGTYISGSSLEEDFLQPPLSAKPIMIWQWMDGLVSEAGITADLEAYAEAGIGGVQQFLVGGPSQVMACDTANAIGTENWKRLMRHAIKECARLGLTFGTHNCPGWSSSASTQVDPAFSMQKIVWTDTVVNIRKNQKNYNYQNQRLIPYTIIIKTLRGLPVLTTLSSGLKIL